MSNVPPELLEPMRRALERLKACPEFVRIIPEVRTNLVYAAPGATEPGQVLAIEGRITVVDGVPHASGRPKFGVSDHMARLVIEAGRVDPTVRAGINFANNPKLATWLEEYCRGQGWEFGVIDRSAEPDEMKREEVKSTPWKFGAAVRSAGGRLPKVFYETATTGKEPLSFLLGRDPVEVVDQACAIARAWAKRA